MGGRCKRALMGLAGAALVIAPPVAAPTWALDVNNPRVLGAGPRPQPPAEDPGAFAFEIDCAAAGEKMDQDMERLLADPTSWFGRLEVMGRHSEAMMTWYGQQFVRQGAWTQAEADTFAAGIIERPEMAETLEWITGLLTGMLEDLTRIIELEQSGDKVAACRALEGMMGRLAEMPVRIRTTWTAIDTIYAAAAREEGITLPE